jgi:hypothetical protein
MCYKTAEPTPPLFQQRSDATPAHATEATRDRHDPTEEHTEQHRDRKDEHNRNGWQVPGEHVKGHRLCILRTKHNQRGSHKHTDDQL